MFSYRPTWRSFVLLCSLSVSYLVVVFFLRRRGPIALEHNLETFKKHLRLPTLTHTHVPALISSNASIPLTNETTNRTVTLSQVNRATRFDIVVSYYNENLTDVAVQLDGLMSIPQLKQYNDTRVIIYTKNPEVDLSVLRAALGAEVVLLPNKGREAGAYLAHILQTWDNLADHTMFVQALMHFPIEATRKAQDYLAPPSNDPAQPSTGLLTMGYLSNCQCTSCHDAWDGSITWSRVSELYVLLNSQLCPKDIVITYLGQFIVSKKRIWSRNRAIYQYIKDILESDLEHWIHEDPRRADFNDKPENPYFGHTMERAWMVLWDCNDLQMLESCGNGLHSLINGRLDGDPIQKCQCMDP